jgi:hypothetical protein
MERKITEEELDRLFTRSLQAENYLYAMRENGAHPNDIAQAERFSRFYEHKIVRAVKEWREQCGH